MTLCETESRDIFPENILLTSQRGKSGHLARERQLSTEIESSIGILKQFNLHSTTYCSLGGRCPHYSVKLSMLFTQLLSFHYATEASGSVADANGEWLTARRSFHWRVRASGRKRREKGKADMITVAVQSWLTVSACTIPLCTNEPSLNERNCLHLCTRRMGHMESHEDDLEFPFRRRRSTPFLNRLNRSKEKYLAEISDTNIRR